jgi:hypothetical protein
MKKYLMILVVLVCFGANANAQNVEIREITSLPDGSYTVIFRNHDNDAMLLGATPDYATITWYLSYKGKRISDYYRTSVGYGNKSATAMAWPDVVPKGNEKYVTAQLGKEPAKKDRRD